MNIVTMAQTHLPSVAALERACFSQPWSESGLAAELGRGIFLVAEQAGAVLGYLGCQTVLDEGYITNVAVFPHARRRGVAAALVRELLTRARAQGLSFVTLEVRAGNDAARALYEAMGFEAVGVRPAFYSSPTEDAVLMTAYLKRNESE